MSCPHGHIEGDCDICIEVEAAFDNGYEQGKAAKNSPKIAEVKAHSFLGEEIGGLWVTYADYMALEKDKAMGKDVTVTMVETGIATWKRETRCDVSHGMMRLLLRECLAAWTAPASDDSADDKLRSILAIDNYRTDGDTATLLDRVEHAMRSARDFAVMQSTLIARHEEAARGKAVVPEVECDGPLPPGYTLGHDPREGGYWPLRDSSYIGNAWYTTKEAAQVAAWKDAHSRLTGCMNEIRRFASLAATPVDGGV